MKISPSRIFGNNFYMFENGRIVEQGTHEELIAENGKYAYMFNLQAEKYRKNNIAAPL